MTARAPSRRMLFADDDDRRLYLTLLGAQVQERGWELFNFCLMGNHVHALLRTPDTDLGVGIKAAHGRFATLVNGRREEHGHLFGSRFYNGIVLHQSHFEASMRYVSRNPVAAGLCARAEDWSWSAHNALVGAATPPSFLDVEGALSLIHRSRDAAKVAYESWVAWPDVAVLATLEATMPGDTWLLSAVDHHRVPIAAIAEFKRWSRSATYARLRDPRRTWGSVP